VRQWQRATVATPGEWQCKTARSGEWANILLVIIAVFAINMFGNMCLCWPIPPFQPFLFKRQYPSNHGRLDSKTQDNQNYSFVPLLHTMQRDF